ncbi:MAG: hypothetical protein IIA49_14095, partial [Bacteroidetes bacterium]|nr:hypothetical protein [Bacteroidota bacterium]
MNTLLEYAFEHSPTKSESFEPVQVSKETDEEDGEIFLHFSYTRRKGGTGSSAFYNAGCLSYLVEY